MSLIHLANNYKTDKGTKTGSKTGFAAAYEHLFKDIKNEKIKMLEIGLNNGGPEHGSQRFSRIIEDCPSIRMWHDYFQNGDIWGFDINDLDSSLLLKLDRFRFSKGDQGSSENLNNLVKDIKKHYGDNYLFDLVIDDGSHAFYHQQKTFSILSEIVRPGGYYVIEDIQWQPNQNIGGAKAGGVAPFDVKSLPATVNTGKLVSQLLCEISEDQKYLKFTSNKKINKSSLKTSQIFLFEERRPEIFTKFINEIKLYDRLNISCKSCWPEIFKLGNCNGKDAIFLKKKEQNAI